MSRLVVSSLNLVRRKSVSVLALIAIASPGNAQSVRPDSSLNKPDFSNARKLIQDRMITESIPSFSVAVARKGEILWEESFGLADREQRVPATKDTLYYLASVTKSITATSIMVLNERKQLDIDRPINEYLGAARLSSPRWNVKGATVRRVATHTAGLTTFVQNRFGVPANFQFSQDQIIRRYGVVFFPPGDHFDYSNLGYGILGEVVGRVSGKGYEAFLRDEIFRPLGMTHATLGQTPAVEKLAAKRYSSDFGHRPGAASGTPGASTVYCSAHDLLQFGMFHLKAHLPNQKAILSDVTIDLMQNATVEVGDGGRYGLGWWVKENLYGYRSVLGQGGTNDASASLQLIPTEGIVVVALANTGTTLPGDVIHEVLSTLLPPYREKRVADLNKTPKQPQTATVPPNSMVGNWKGFIRTYRGNLPLGLSISSLGEVQATLESQPVTTFKNPRFENERLTGITAGALNTDEDTGPDPYDLDFELYLRGNELNGAVTTRPQPGAKQFTRLPFWVELQKLKTKAAKVQVKRRTLHARRTL